MMEQIVIPSPDAMPLPAPVWLLKSLLLFTFFLHIVAMNIVLGGGFVAFFAELRGRKTGNEHYRTLAQSFGSSVPVALAFAITLGIAPLLFVQVLYGQLFYTATILMGWPWLSVILFVIVAYYSFYFYKFGSEKRSTARLLVLLLGALLVGAVAMLFRNAATLMLHPGSFNTIYQSDAFGQVMSVDDTTTLPRYLHFFIGAIAVTGLYIMLVGLRRMANDSSFGRWALRQGSIIFASATVVEMGVGIWFLVALPREVMLLFMGDDLLATVLLGMGFLLPVGSMMLLMMAIKAERPFRSVVGGVTMAVLTLVVMVMMRDVVRDGYLSGTFDVSARTVEPMWGVIGLFVVLLVAGLATVGYMLRLAKTETV